VSEVTGSGAQAPQPGGDRAGGPDRTPGPRVGLCETCVHQRVVRNTRGSSFSLCERSRSDPAYPRYPRVPVLECAGHEPGGTGETG
jgi:hypothetical protein